MDQSRRGFLGKALGGVAAVGLAALPAADAAVAKTTLQHGIPAWSGWLRAPHQTLQWGYWFMPIGIRERILISTSLGHVGVYQPTDQFDMAISAGWPIISIRSSHADRVSVKVRSLENLQSRVKQFISDEAARAD